MSLVADPIATEVVGNRLISIANEMSASLIRSAYSTMVKESADASSAILDRGGRLLAQSEGTIVLHTSSLRECLKAVLEDYRIEEMRNGDAYVMNDPYRGGIHSNDLAVLAPVVIAGRVEYFTGTLVHVADLGGVSAGGLPSQARDVFQEGLLLPPMLFCREGEIRRDVRNLLCLNSRAPQKVWGDINALLAAATVGVRQMAELAERYSQRKLSEIIDQVLHYTEARVRSEIAQLPLGEWTSEFTVDGDGVTPNRSYAIRVTLRHRQREEIEVDLSGSDAQASGPINAAYSQALSAVLIGIRCYLDADILMNEGVFRPIKATLPVGTLVNPQKPAAVNARVVTVTAIIEAMLEVLGKVSPKRAIAGSAMIHVYTMASRETDRNWLFQDVDFGGIGARADLDGVNASGPYFLGGRGLTIQMEAVEAEYPVRFTALKLLPDSGGPGKYRGGAGLLRELIVLEPVEITVRADRIVRPPAGRNGGHPGRPGGWVVQKGTETKQLQSKEMCVPLEAGTRFAMLTSGGGGFGNPMERGAKAVCEDVRTGIVSIEGAANDYGVVVMPERYECDPARTERLRKTAGKCV